VSRFEKWSVTITAIAATLTGAGLFWAKYMLHSDDPWAVVNHPWQPWLLKAHVITAPLLVFAVGLIASRHIWRHYREGIPWGRRSGILTGLVTVPMVLTGYLIQIATHEGWLGILAISHIVLGFLFAAGLGAHQLFVWRRRERAEESAASRQPPLRRGRAPDPRRTFAAGD
jgi:hypothetical protein